MDLICREDAILALVEKGQRSRRYRLGEIWELNCEEIREALNDLPSVEPEIKPVGYIDCANAMLRMWMDKVVTDGEYNRIMDKLNTHEMKKTRR